MRWVIWIFPDVVTAVVTRDLADDGVTTSQGLATDGDALYAVGLHSESTAGSGRHGDGAGGADSYFGLDDVLCPVAFGGGDIAGQGEVGERGDGDVVGTANAGFEHAAAPYGDAELLGYVVNGDGFGEATDAACLDVDDLPAAEFESCAGVTTVANTLVETDSRVDTMLQSGVEIEVIVP